MISGSGTIGVVRGTYDSFAQFCFPSGSALDVMKDHIPSSGAQSLLSKSPILEKISAIPFSGLDEHKHLFANEHPTRPAPIP